MKKKSSARAKKTPRFALITSEFNPEVTGGLRAGSLAYLKEQGVTTVDQFDAPGAFEMPLLAQRLARTKRYDAVICLGCVIKGDTAHFEYISLGATIGLMQAQLATEVPMTFGILTVYTDDQAIDRSRPNAENKGREAAAAAWGQVKRLAAIGKSR